MTLKNFLKKLFLGKKEKGGKDSENYKMEIIELLWDQLGEDVYRTPINLEQILKFPLPKKEI